MSKKRVAAYTLGCKVNQYETDAIRLQFIQAGFEWVSLKERADIYLVNTCAVTTEAERKSRQALRRLKKQNPAALVVAMGCQVVVGDAADWTDLAIANEEKNEVCRIVCDYLAASGEMIQATKIRSDYNELGPVSEQSETRALVKIEDGCNQACAYCIIPQARGRVASRAQADIEQEVRLLAANGYREIVLTGIHICSYGSDLGLPEDYLAKLALDLSEISGIERIRLGSLEPRFVTDSFIGYLARNEKLCPHFHLSLQSGSDKVLKTMNRRYTTAGYSRAVNGLRKAFADPAITTDVIVGFPGESEEDFAESLSFCREMQFSRMHVFRYSERPQTVASRMTNKVPPHERAERAAQMIQLADDLAEQYLERQIGRQGAVIVEKSDADGYYHGYLANYSPVWFKSHAKLKTGDLVNVNILKKTKGGLIGEQTG